MVECENCKYTTTSKFNCDKIIGYKPSAHYYSGALYARPDKENKTGDCEYFDFSILNHISSKVKGLCK